MLRYLLIQLQGKNFFLVITKQINVYSKIERLYINISKKSKIFFKNYICVIAIFSAIKGA